MKIRRIFRNIVILLILLASFVFLLYIAFEGGLFSGSKRIENAIYTESNDIKGLIDSRANSIEDRLGVVEGKLDRIESKIDLLIKMATPVLPDGMKVSD